MYLQILQGYDWEDEEFRGDYDLVMGSNLVAKSPKSIAVLKSLHRTHSATRIDDIMLRLGPLLVGWKDPKTPIIILHSSFCDFLTSHVQNSPNSKPCYISEASHDRRLALSCFTVLNQNLNHDTPGVGYLNECALGIPDIAMEQISEVWYARKFWFAHLVNFEPPLPIPGDVVTRPEDAPTAIPEAVELLREFSNWRPSFEPNLAKSLDNLCRCLSDMGDREDSLAAIREVVELRRRLAKENPS